MSRGLWKKGRRSFRLDVTIGRLGSSEELVLYRMRLYRWQWHEFRRQEQPPERVPQLVLYSEVVEYCSTVPQPCPICPNSIYVEVHTQTPVSRFVRIRVLNKTPSALCLFNQKHPDSQNALAFCGTFCSLLGPFSRKRRPRSVLQGRFVICKHRPYNYNTDTVTLRRYSVNLIVYGVIYTVKSCPHFRKGKLQYHLNLCPLYNKNHWLTILECRFLIYQPNRN